MKRTRQKGRNRKMKKYLRDIDRKVLELIDGCLTQEEAIEKVINFFGYIPANLDIVCWVAFDALRVDK